MLRRLGEDGLEISCTKQTAPYQTNTAQATGLKLTAGTVIKLKLVIDSSSKRVKLEVNDVVKATSAQVADTFSEFWFGGSPAGCGWEQADCAVGVSRTLYTSFVGSFHTVVLGEERQLYEKMGGKCFYFQLTTPFRFFRVLAGSFGLFRVPSDSFGLMKAKIK